MKSPALPVLALAEFEQRHRHLYYIQQLDLHVARFPRVSTPHAHDFYLLLYITQGHGTHTIDLITYDLQPGSLFLLMPGQVHCWSLSADTQGLILFFGADFYLQHYPAGRLAEYPFFNPANSPVCYLAAGEQAIGPLFERIYQEETAPAPAANRDEVVRASLYLVLELAARHYAPALLGTSTPAAPPAHGLLQMREFGRLLNQHFRTQKTVRYYADQLALSANHLNAICRRILNKTASHLIHERVVAEAKRQLIHSAQTVAQVASELGFEDASYFARYFKKYVGQPPEVFRQPPKTDSLG
jgi:AraC family transcriptional activator of pobA